MNKKGPISADCELPYVEASLPLWRELFWGVEWLRLRASPVYRGHGVPAGHGVPVVLVPGFLASDLSLREMHLWLERVGYHGYRSGIGRNDDCPDVLLAELLEKVEAVARKEDGRVRLIGHSLGGTLARAAAALRPDLVSQVISLGSPLRDGRVSPLVLEMAMVVSAGLTSPDAMPRAHGDHFHDGTCVCGLLDVLGRPFPAGVARASVYSRTDGVVGWESSVDEPPGQNVEVHASHLGLPVNVEAYVAVAKLLAAAARPAGAPAA